MLLLLSLIAVKADSALDDLSLDDDFPLDDQVAAEDYPQSDIAHSGADYISDENESTGVGDYKASPTSFKKETIIYNAMLEALKRPEMSQQLGQVTTK